MEAEKLKEAFADSHTGGATGFVLDSLTLMTAGTTLVMSTRTQRILKT